MGIKLVSCYLSAMLICWAPTNSKGEVLGYLCFFDNGSAELTYHCRDVIQRFAASWQRVEERRQSLGNAPSVTLYPARVRVEGYAPDAVNSKAADKLSLSRAAAVARMLGQSGVPPDLITVIGRGSEQHLVPKAPKDPQNHLVELTLL